MITSWLPKSESEIEKRHILELEVMAKMEEKYNLSAFKLDVLPDKDKVYRDYAEGRINAETAKKLGIDLF
jgi:hypothetical protein